MNTAAVLAKSLALAATLCLLASAQSASAQVCSKRAAIVVDTVVDQDVVSTPISNVVDRKIKVYPAVVAPVDTLKLQAMNRIDAGLLNGALTMDEATELRLALDDVIRQEDEFKLAAGGMTYESAANLQRKYHMINRSISDSMSNSNTADYMPSVENRRTGLQNRIVYNQAAGNLTPAESEQLLTSLAMVSDHYAEARATGGTITGDELEQLHRELYQIRLNIGRRVCGTITVVSPDTVNSRQALLQTIQSGIASGVLQPEEGQALMKTYARLTFVEQAIARDGGVRSQEMKNLAKEVDSLNFVLRREIRDRQIAGTTTRF